MSSTTPRRVAVVFAFAAFLALPAASATPATPAIAAVRVHGSTPVPLSFFEQASLLLADLLGLPAPAPAAGRHGLTARHADLGGFIDPDGSRLLSQATGTTALATP